MQRTHGSTLLVGARSVLSAVYTAGSSGGSKELSECVYRLGQFNAQVTGGYPWEKVCLSLGGGSCVLSLTPPTSWGTPGKVCLRISWWGSCVLPLLPVIKKTFDCY